MLILQPDEVPHKSSEQFQNLENTSNTLCWQHCQLQKYVDYTDTSCLRLYFGQRQSCHPREPEDHVLDHDDVVDVGAGVHQLLPQPLVTSIISSEETKVHLEIPEYRVEGRDNLAGEPGVEERCVLHCVTHKTTNKIIYINKAGCPPPPSS